MDLEPASVFHGEILLEFEAVLRVERDKLSERSAVCMGPNGARRTGTVDRHSDIFESANDVKQRSNMSLREVEKYVALSPRRYPDFQNHSLHRVRRSIQSFLFPSASMPSSTTFIPSENFDFYGDGHGSCIPVNQAIYWFAETEAFDANYFIDQEGQPAMLSINPSSPFPQKLVSGNNPDKTLSPLTPTHDDPFSFQPVSSVSPPRHFFPLPADDREILNTSSCNLDFTPLEVNNYVSPRELHCSIGAEIPQRVYQSPRCFNCATGKSFWFSVRGGTPGFPVAAALDRHYADLDGRDELMPLNSSGTSISIRLEWKGYEPWTRQIKSHDWRKIQSPIPKSKVATEIGKVLERFIGIMQDQPQQYSEWRVGPGFIEAKDLVLVGLKQVSKSSYQPILRRAA